MSNPQWIAYVKAYIGKYPPASLKAGLMKAGATAEQADAAILEAQTKSTIPEIDVRMGAAERTVRKADRASGLAAEAAVEARKAFDPKGFFELAKAVFKTPREFFKSMPTSGGFMPPLVFAGTMGALGGAILWAVTVVFSGSLMAGFGAFVGGLIMAPVGALIGGGFGFVLWRALGSSREFEIAFRCCAYASAVSVVAIPAAGIPYLGVLLGLGATGWSFYLLYLASIEVHGIEERKAKIAMAVLAALCVLGQLSAQWRVYQLQQALTAAQRN